MRGAMKDDLSDDEAPTVSALKLPVEILSFL